MDRQPHVFLGVRTGLMGDQMRTRPVIVKWRRLVTQIMVAAKGTERLHRTIIFNKLTILVD